MVPLEDWPLLIKHLQKGGNKMKLTRKAIQTMSDDQLVDLLMKADIFERLVADIKAYEDAKRLSSHQWRPVTQPDCARDATPPIVSIGPSGIGGPYQTEL